MAKTHPAALGTMYTRILTSMTHTDGKAEETSLPPKETKEREKYSKMEIETKVMEITEDKKCPRQDSRRQRLKRGSRSGRERLSPSESHL